MKKFIIAISIIAALGLNVNAQEYYQYSGSDGFFSSNSMVPGYREDTGTGLPLLPMRGQGVDQNAVPLGSGLLILAGLGAAYALKKRRD